MKNKNICKICNCEIREDQPTFIFPKLHDSFNLGYLTGESHSTCLRKIDKKLELSNLLAIIHESIAKNSEESKLICRNGNIIVCARFDEKRVEIYDYEDFCNISLSAVDLDKILGINPYGIIPIAKIEGFILNVLKNGKLSLEDLKYQYELSKLNLIRLREILSCIKIDTYFGESLEQEFIRKAKK